MLAKVESACLIGLDAAPVHVEVNLSKGLPYFSIVGLPDASVREAKDRVVAAIRNAGFEFPGRRVTVNLAPAGLKKEGAVFDLAIAVGVLMASEAITPPRWPKCVWLGELALDGGIRSIRGALPLVRSLTLQGWKECALPQANAEQASFIQGIQVRPFKKLRDVAAWLNGEIPTPCVAPHPLRWQPGQTSQGVDMADIKGQAAGKRALEIAAAGGHNLLFVGCPGAGKTLLARALPTVLPTWSLEDALESSLVYSVGTPHMESGLLTTRPFRSPHHTVSSVALVGGGETPMPGEISLAHRGVLFMDELPEFHRDALEALRQPLEEGKVHIRRIRGHASYPAEFQLIAAMNPCPCGYRGHPKRECTCTTYRVEKYMAKVSGPFLDRMDLQVEIPALKMEELFADDASAESSHKVRERVERARHTQAERYSDTSTFGLNASLRAKDLKRYCRLDEPGKLLLRAAVDRLGFSARAFDKIRKVARTIADLEGANDIQASHLAEAIQYRFLDRKSPVN